MSPSTAVPPRPAVDDALAQEVAHLLDLARAHLDMDVAFLGRFDGDERRIELVAARDDAAATRLVGASSPRTETYCDIIADGSLDPVTRDTHTLDRLARLDVTWELGIGSYLGVPITEADGSVWGTVCSYTHDAAPRLVEADAGVLRFIADVISTRLAVLDQEQGERLAAAASIDDLLALGEPTMVGQPVVDLHDRHVVGVEALARFRSGRPLEVFALAITGDRSRELEMAAAAAALRALDELPEDQWLSCNVSLTTAIDERFVRLLDDVDPQRLVLEVTEHEQATDEVAAASALAPHRLLGARVAMDDIGAGWSGLERALRIEPEILKLDRALVTGLHVDRGRRALVRAICAYAEAVNASVVAEGIEVEDEARALRDLGVPLGQGWLLGRPSPLPGATTAVT